MQSHVRLPDLRIYLFQISILATSIQPTLSLFHILLRWWSLPDFTGKPHVTGMSRIQYGLSCIYAGPSILIKFTEIITSIWSCGENGSIQPKKSLLEESSAKAYARRCKCCWLQEDKIILVSAFHAVFTGSAAYGLAHMARWAKVWIDSNQICSAKAYYYSNFAPEKAVSRKIQVKGRASRRKSNELLIIG